MSQPVSTMALPACPSQASVPPPSRSEVQRRLSTRTKPQKATIPAPVSGNDSDSSVASSTVFPLNTSCTGAAFTASPAPSPVVGAAHGPLSAIAERQGSSMDMDAIPDDPDTQGVDDGDDSEEEGTQDDDVEGQRVYKSGFLIKRQERRKGVWRKKWFVLRSTSLAYYKDNREYRLSRAIDLHGVHSVVPVVNDKQKHPFAFAVVTSDRTFFLEALSANERDDWVQAVVKVQKRMIEKEEEARRKAEPKAVPVPVPTTRRQEQDVEPHQGTWASTFSSTTASSSPGGGQMYRNTASPSLPPSSYQAPGLQPPPTAFQPPPPLAQQQRASSPGAGPSNLSVQMAHLSAGSPTYAPGSPYAAQPPSAASVNRRLSNPIGLKPRAPPSRDASGSSTIDTPVHTLSPPSATPQFISSDEEETYFSDPTAWAEQPIAPANKIILATYLMKKSRKTAREVWRKRWFYLTSAGITYSKSHMDQRPLTFIPLPAVLDVFSVDTASDDEDGEDSESELRQPPQRHTSLRSKEKPRDTHPPDQHVIRIVTSKRRYDLCAPSEEEEIKWIAAIRALLNRERGQQTPLSPRTEGGFKFPVPTISQQPPTPSVNPTSPPAAEEQSSPASAPAPPFHQTHTRSRSATQTAKNAVADVVRRFQENH